MSSSELARSSAAERSGKAERDRFSIRSVGDQEFAERLVEVTPVHGDRPFGHRGTRLGECRALAGVVAAFELAVGALEVVFVEATVIDDPPVVVDSNTCR